MLYPSAAAVFHNGNGCILGESCALTRAQGCALDPLSAKHHLQKILAGGWNAAKLPDHR